MTEAKTYEKRFMDLIDLLKRNKLDIIIAYSDVWRCGNTQYFTGWWPTGGGISQASVFLLVTEKERPSLLVGFEQVQDANRLVLSADAVGSEKIEGALRGLADHSSRVGIIGTNIMPYSYRMTMSSVLPNAEFVDLTNEIDIWRRIKADWEIVRLRNAAKCSDDAIMSAFASLKLGSTEEEIMAAGLSAIGKNGAVPSFFPVVGIGPNSAVPMRYPRAGKPLDKPSLVLLDFGARLRGYAGDISRTIVMGEATKDERNIVNAAIQANQEVISLIKPGMRSHEVNDQVRQSIINNGFGAYIAHDSSHGVGIDHEEQFPIKLEDDIELRVNMVFTIEAGIYVPGVGGARVEDVVAITETGCEVLNKAPHSMGKEL